MTLLFFCAFGICEDKAARKYVDEIDPWATKWKLLAHVNMLVKLTHLYVCVSVCLIERVGDKLVVS